MHELDGEISVIAQRLKGLEKAIEDHILAPDHANHTSSYHNPSPRHSSLQGEVKRVWDELEKVKRDLVPILQSLQNGKDQASQQMMECNNLIFQLQHQIVGLKKEK